MKKVVISIIFVLVALLLISNSYVYFTNPFHAITIVQNPYSASISNGKMVLHKNFDLNVQESLPVVLFGYYKAGVHILVNNYFGSPKATGTTEKEIIAEIHALRFDPTKPFLISGDHFSMLYPRNLAIFYGSILDTNTAVNEKDFQNREAIYLESTAYALDTFSKTKDLATTIVPVGPHSVTTINIFSYPSDTLYSMLYAIFILKENAQTKDASDALLHQYKDTLKQLVFAYKQTVYDANTGLIKKTIYISSARDSVKRESSFYDNVVYWKTIQLANELGIANTPQKDVDALKNRIIHMFWYENGGYFLNDLSQKSLSQKIYSSDFLIVLSTKFLDLQNQTERAYLEKSVAYIQKNNIDKPFGLKYQAVSSPEDEFGFVRYFVPAYGQNAIWSHWGIEYIKLLIGLYQATGNKAYLSSARTQLARYEKNIVINRGYPEVYDENGHFLENPFYKSVRQTGWVVNFEEANYLFHHVQ